MGVEDQPPYLRIVTDIRDRIASGQLRAGDRVPSTRQIVAEWGVAMATATKALATLRQEGLVRAVSGSGTVVAEQRSHEPARRARRADGTDPRLSQERVVGAAIAIADQHGRAAVSIRRIAAEMGVGAMSVYRHVPDKDELLRLMTDTAFGEEEPPEPGPAGWRAKLELVARMQWRMYRRHPWLAPAILTSFDSPPAVASGMRLVDWELRALDGLGPDRRSRLYLAITLNGYVGGVAMARSLEVESERDTGISGAQRFAADGALIEELKRSGRFPALASFEEGEGVEDLDALFEFGLQRQLDGIAAFLGAPPRPRG